MKLLKICAMILAATLLLAGCSKSMDISKTCDTILANVKFDDEMMKLESSLVANYYSLPTTGIEEYVIYVSATMATANEFAIFRVKDNAAATALKSALVTRVESQVASYENYVPSELNRINNKLIVQKGDYLLFAITDDNDDIQDIFNNALK